jgi:hypothetical protein
MKSNAYLQTGKRFNWPTCLQQGTCIRIQTNYNTLCFIFYYI